MTTGEQKKSTIDLYTSLMEEVKGRIEAIEVTLIQQKTALADLLAREFCALQLRMICELIALGCLVTHGDIPETRSRNLSRARYADRIIAGLEKLHPEFYRTHPGKAALCAGEV